MNITVNEDLKAYIDPLSPEEYFSLESSLLAEGCRDALVLWGDVLVDGHNRYSLCQKHGLPFQTVQNTRFKTLEDVHLWMIDQHLGRRSVSDYQRGVLALRKKEILTERQAAREAAKEAAKQAAVAVGSNDSNADGNADGNPLPWEDAAGSDAAQGSGTAAQAPEAPLTREALAKAARLSNSQVTMIEKIQKQAAPEVVAAVKSGSISINAAAAVASLPAEEQVAAAHAGKDELKLAAKRVREAKRKPREQDGEGASQDTSQGAPQDVKHLQLRIDELIAENLMLRQQVAELEARLAQS